MQLREHYAHQSELKGKLNIVEYNKSDAQSYLRNWAPVGESGSAPAPTAEQSGDMDASTSTLDRLDALLEAAKLTEEAEDDVEEAAFDALLATVQEKVQKEQEDGESDAEMELAAVGQITSIKIKMSPLAAGTDFDLSHPFPCGRCR